MAFSFFCNCKRLPASCPHAKPLQPTNLNQLAVRDALYKALTQAFGRSGIAWDSCVSEDRGDGVLDGQADGPARERARARAHRPAHRRVAHVDAADLRGRREELAVRHVDPRAESSQ